MVLVSESPMFLTEFRMSIAFPFAQMKMASLRGLLSPWSFCATICFLAVILICLLVLSPSLALAQPPQFPPPPQAPDLPTRVEKLEKRVTALEQRLHPTTAAAAPSEAFTYQQVCVNGKCYMMKVPAATAATRTYGEFIYDPQDSPSVGADPSPTPAPYNPPSTHRFRPIRNFIAKIRERRSGNGAGSGCSTCGG